MEAGYPGWPSLRSVALGYRRSPRRGFRWGEGNGQTKSQRTGKRSRSWWEGQNWKTFTSPEWESNLASTRSKLSFAGHPPAGGRQKREDFLGAYRG